MQQDLPVLPQNRYQTCKTVAGKALVLSLWDHTRSSSKGTADELDVGQQERLTETVFLSTGLDLKVRVTVRSMSFMGVPVDPFRRYFTR